MKQIGLLRAMLLAKKADKMTLEERRQIQQKRLQELIAYAKENSPYYAKLYEGIDSNTPFSQLPTTNKMMLMEHFDDWMTDSNITKEKVEQFMTDVSNVGKKLENKYLIYTTSGSTGNPCVVLYDDTTTNVASAIGVTRSFARAEDLKAFIKNGKKTMALFADGGFYLASGSVHYQQRKMPWKKKTMRTFDVRRTTKEIVDELNAFQPTMLGTYPSTCELLVKEQEEGRLNIHPVIIMTGGEYLSEDVRERITKAFDCYVQTNYSCTEGGTVACECVNHHFHVNDDWVILEAVDEANQPVPFGTQSSKVLLTNLANRICPIIRFEITDRIVMHEEACTCGNSRPWLTLEGRTDDILTFHNGIQISPLSLYIILKEVHRIQRFQLVQRSESKLELRLISKEPEAAFIEAKNALLQYLNQNGVECEILYSEKEPEIHPVSGKFKHVLKEFE